jgi:DNA-binding MarR family transcriptional regulator
MSQLSSAAEQATAATFDGLEAIAIALVAITARAVYEEAASQGLTLLHWRAFVELAGGPLRLGELAARLPASIPATSKLVTRLASRGFLAASPDPDDARALQIALTEAGRDLRTRVLRRRRALIVAGVGAATLPSTLEAGLLELGVRLRAATSDPTFRKERR